MRLFNTVGPRQTGQYGMVLPGFIQQALSQKPLTVYGDGSQQRCFCSVYDVISGLLRLVQVHEAAGQAVNLGSNEEISILNLAKKVIQITGSTSSIEVIPYEKAYGPGFDDMQRRVPDLTRAARYMSWTPQHTLDDIIQDIVEWNLQGMQKNKS